MTIYKLLNKPVSDGVIAILEGVVSLEVISFSMVFVDIKKDVPLPFPVVLGEGIYEHEGRHS